MHENILIIGLTGSICSGKTLIADFFKEKNAIILDADQISKDLSTPGQQAWHEIINEFGEEIIHANKSINRKLLADIVFNNPKQLKKLEQILHPKIKDEILKKINQEQKKSIVVIDAPLLLEAKFDDIIDLLIVVSCKKSILLERAQKRNSSTIQEIKKRLKYQMPLKNKIKKADYIINNNTTINETRRQFELVWKKITKKQIH